MYVASQAIRPLLRIRAEATVPTRFGEFAMIVFNYDSPDPETGLSPDHVALVRGIPSKGNAPLKSVSSGATATKSRQNVLCRVHSECLTSEVFGSLKCDCRDQLEAAQQEIARVGEGVILYLRQEGRGIGLANKIRAYELQSAGHDTVDANRLLDLPDDARSYEGAAAMLGHLGIGSIKLITNNPQKVEALESHGIVISERVSSLIHPNAFSHGYLEAKRQRMNHQLPHLRAVR